MECPDDAGRNGPDGRAGQEDAGSSALIVTVNTAVDPGRAGPPVGVGTGEPRPSGSVDAPPDGRVAQRVSVMLSSSANPEPPAKKGDPFASRITLKPAFRSTCRETEEPKAPHDPVDG